MHKRVFEIDPWKLKSNKLEHENIRLVESLTSTGNGHMGLRGNFEEGYSGDSHKGTYIAGVWFPDRTRVGWWKNGYPDYFGKVINAMDFITVDITINDSKLDLNQVSFEDFYLELDMQKGLLTRQFTYLEEDTNTKVRFSFRRFVSIVTLEASFQCIDVEVLRGKAKIKLTPLLDVHVKNLDSNYDEMFWEPLDRGAEKTHYLTARTIGNPFDIPQFTVTGLMKNKLTANGIEYKNEQSKSTWKVTESFELHLNQDEQCRLEKTVVVLTSRDIPSEQQLTKGKNIINTLGEHDFEEHLSQHAQAWQERWDRADVLIDGDKEAQQGIRFNIFQLLQTYYGHDERLNIGPKGFTGEKYGGATYWDTEAFILPMYLSITDPSVTEKLLHYRYRHLPAAIRNANKLGLKGALYPMVTFNGEECHNEWEITFEEIHRNGTIAYAIYHFTKYTGDRSFLEDYGIEVLVEISRFWADRVHFSDAKQQYMMHGVTGPNEYENNVNNNWYTNFIAQWNLSYTMQCLADLGAKKKLELKVSDGELKHWADIVERMYLPTDSERNIFVQHDTFLDKDLRIVDTLKPKDIPLWQNWSWDRILRSCFIKQADVLQGLYYFRDQFTREEIESNFKFYEPMTVHESSLSASIHSVLAAQLGLEDKAVELYSRTARLDLDNYNNDTEDGLHITSMSGSWLCIVQGFGGMNVTNGLLLFKPFVPKDWKGYGFKISFRERLLEIKVDKERTTITLLRGESLELKVHEEMIMLEDLNSPASISHPELER